MKPCGYGLGMSGTRSCAIPRGVLPPSARARPIPTPPFTRRAAANIRSHTDAVRSLYLYSKRNYHNQQSSCRAREYASAPFSPPDNDVAAAVMASVLAWDWRCSTSRWVYHLTDCFWLFPAVYALNSTPTSLKRAACSVVSHRANLARSSSNAQSSGLRPPCPRPRIANFPRQNHPLKHTHSRAALKSPPDSLFVDARHLTLFGPGGVGWTEECSEPVATLSGKSEHHSFVKGPSLPQDAINRSHY